MGELSGLHRFPDYCASGVASLARDDLGCFALFVEFPLSVGSSLLDFRFHLCYPAFESP